MRVKRSSWAATPSFFETRDLMGNDPKHRREPAVLHEGVPAEAGDTRQLVHEIEIVRLGEPLLVFGRQHLIHQSLRLEGREHPER